MKFKKAKPSGNAAAVLVAIIAALIVIYILFLPPAERQALLEGEVNETGALIAEGGNITLLSESPGRLDHERKRRSH